MWIAAQRAMIVVTCAAIAASGCAAHAGTRIAPMYAAPGSDGRTVLIEYVQKLPPGTAVRIDRVKGRTLRGTLMKATGERIFLQPKTRLPEGVIEISMDEVVGVMPDTPGGNNVARAIGVGAAAGAAAALGVFLIIIALVSD
jgi:hypothetical protein